MTESRLVHLAERGDIARPLAPRTTNPPNKRNDTLNVANHGAPDEEPECKNDSAFHHSEDRRERRHDPGDHGHGRIQEGLTLIGGISPACYLQEVVAE